MNTIHIQTAQPLSVRVLSKRLIKLERAGRYEDGLAMFGEGSFETDFLPSVVDLSADDAAETLLRFGSLTGFFGYKHQIAGAQERSKDILTHARSLYSDLQNVAKTAECENHIALGYWRKGELQEAGIWIEEALSHDLPVSSDARLYAHVTKSLIQLSERNYHENIADCLAVESDFRLYGDAFLNGSLSTNVGLSFKNISNNAEAMRYLTLARFFHEKSRHKVYLGTVFNNLAQLYKMERRFDDAHEAANAAIKLYKQLKDKTREGSTIDTIAQIYFAERKYPQATTAADRSIAMLRKSESAGYLSESLLTKAKILLFSDNFSDAVLNLVDAVNITRVQNSEDAARVLIDEFEAALGEKNMPAVKTQSIEKGELELVLPASIGNYSEYKGVWINSGHLEGVGIKRGSLAIVVPEIIKRGDLVAVAERESEQVVCGFYDAEFGIVCLERGDDDPQLFNEDDIRVLGKIVGVCNSGRDTEGKMVVEAVNH